MAVTRFLVTCLTILLPSTLIFVPPGATSGLHSSTIGATSGLHSSTIVGIVFGAVAGLFGVAAVVFMVVRKCNVLSSIKLPNVSFHNPNYDRQKEARPAGSDETAAIYI